MKSIRFSFLAVLGLFAALSGFAPAAAHAQVAEGKFSLASETHWGRAVLPSGDYTFSLESAGRPAWITIRNGEHVLVGMIMPDSLSTTPYSETSELVLTHVGDQVFVSSLRVGDLGVAFSYFVPETAAPSETDTREGGVSLALKKALRLH